MKLSVANHNEAKNPNNFIHYDDLEFSDIPEIARSGFAYSAGKFKNNHRSNSDWEGCVDVLILDVDNGCSIEQAKNIFKKYENYIIPTRSHQKEKNGFACDRFRIFLHLSEEINDANVMDKFMNRIMTIYPFVDISTKDRGRFWYSSPSDAEVFYNKGINIPVIATETAVEQQTTHKTIECTPRGVYRFNELLELWINDYGETLEVENELKEEDKLKGACKILDNEFYKGNRNHTIFSVACMLKRDGLSEDLIIKFLCEENDKRDGMKFNEVMQCIRSAFRTV